MAFSLAHLSDPHITTGPLAALPAAGLHKALSRTLGLDPRPDCVVISGDLADHGEPQAYAALRTIIGRFPLPVLLAAGNHDEPDALAAEFAGTWHLGGGKETRYRADFPLATVVVLDSKIPGHDPSGHLGAAQLSWLDEALAERPDLPAFVVVHHPPIPVGIPYLDKMRLTDGDALAEVIARHPHTVRVLSGHVHRHITAPFAGTTLAVAPSTYRQTELALHPDRPIGYVDEPTAFLLHLATNTGSCVTHTVAVNPTAALTGHY
ncbi:phosphodiesterase [Streptomycetaceae bacterium NBC_01309]